MEKAMVPTAAFMSRADYYVDPSSQLTAHSQQNIWSCASLGYMIKFADFFQNFFDVIVVFLVMALHDKKITVAHFMIHLLLIRSKRKSADHIQLTKNLCTAPIRQRNVTLYYRDKIGWRAVWKLPQNELKRQAGYEACFKLPS